jgi:hypothetical protein
MRMDQGWSTPEHPRRPGTSMMAGRRREKYGWRPGGISAWVRLWTVLALAGKLFWQTRDVRIGTGRWLNIIARYQLDTGGRPSLADEDGSYSQRAAAIALARRTGTFLSVLTTISGAVATIMVGGPQRFKRGGW